MPIAQSICPICGSSFTTYFSLAGLPKKLYCSDRCKHIGRGLKHRKPQAKHICPICGKVFSTNLARRRVYCSYQCRDVGSHECAHSVTSTCAYCGKKFTHPDRSEWKSGRPFRFCSEACKGKGIAQDQGLHIRKMASFLCEHCGKPFIRMARADRAYRFCSRHCSYMERRGEKHHCWQGGTDRYYGPNWNDARDKALQRDAHICQHCGKEGDNVHHIVARSHFGKDWEAMNDLSNLVTLCSICHSRLHMTLLNAMRKT